MSSERFSRWLTLGLLLSTVLIQESVSASDVSLYSIVKFRRFTQLPSQEPVAESRLYGGEVRVQPATSLDSINIKNSNGTDWDLPVDVLESVWETTTKTSNALNVVFPPGLFHLDFEGQNDGPISARLNLPNVDFPSPPRVGNLSQLQTVDATKPFEIVWAPFGSGNPTNFISVAIYDTNEVGVFSTGDFLSAELLTGAATNLVISTNVLAAGQSYRVAVRFVDVVDKNTVDYPDAVGFVGLGAETTFALTTLGGAGSLSRLEGITQLADGRIQIRCRGMVGSVCRVEFSPDLQSWQKLVELAVSESGTAEYLDSASADRAKFYRLKAN